MFSRPRLRSKLGSLLVAAIVLALEACNGASALDPADESAPLAPASDPVASEAAAAEAAPSTDALAVIAWQRITFTSYRSGNGDIYKMDPQGSSLVRLTSSSAEERAPAWSYGNKRIAFVRPRLDANNVSHDDIYIINVDGTNGHWARATPFPYSLSDPSWSPDGSRIALTVNVQGNRYIGWMDLATGQVGIFNHAGSYYWGEQPSYDPTGKQIVYVGAGGKSIEHITADGSIHLVYVYATTGHPSYSPDVRYRMCSGMLVTIARLKQSADAPRVVPSSVPQPELSAQAA